MPGRFYMANLLSFPSAVVMRSLWGLLLPLFSTVSVAQTPELSEADIEAVAQGLVGTQSPLFLLGGFEAQDRSQILSGREAYLALEGVSSPGGPGFDTPVILYLETRGEDLIRIPTVALPAEWTTAQGQSLQMLGPRGRGPTFKAVWSRRDQGFRSFDLNIGDVSYRGEGISYQVPKLRFRLDTARGVSRLTVKVNQWNADYGRAMGGRETAKNFEFEMRAPTDTMTPSALLALANRMMAALLEVPLPLTAQTDLAQLPVHLHGVSMTMSLASAEWDTASPPSTGGLSEAAFRLEIARDEDGASRIQAKIGLGTFDFQLADNRLATTAPLSLGIDVTGLEPKALVATLFGVGMDVNGAGQDQDQDLVRLPSSITVNGQVEGLTLDVPLMRVEHQLGRLMGQLVVATGEASSDPAQLSLVVEIDDVVLPDFLGREAIEPMASVLLLPMLPSTSRLDVALDGIESGTLAGVANSIASDGIRDAISSAAQDLPDVSNLTLLLGDNFLETSLLSLTMDGAFQLGQPGRIPVRGELSMSTASLVPLQTAIQQALATPIPEVIQALSATILLTTVLQGYAVPTPDDRFNFDLIFDGGLPTINGRELPRIPGL